MNDLPGPFRVFEAAGFMREACIEVGLVLHL
jgi:hypothetical protein